jgi:hypothetical protein
LLHVKIMRSCIYSKSFGNMSGGEADSFAGEIKSRESSQRQSIFFNFLSNTASAVIYSFRVSFRCMYQEIFFY